jgi:CRISPR-associated protein Csx17
VRRLEFGDRAILSAPFVVRSRMGTEGAASAGDDDDSRNEIWMPLWNVPCGVDEIRSLLGEGRATLNGAPPAMVSTLRARWLSWASTAEFGASSVTVS